MKLCRLTCLISAGVVVEDLGVHLAGRGSFREVPAESAQRSKDLKNMQGMVRVEFLPEPRPMPLWPFIKNSPALPPVAVQPVPENVSHRLEEIDRTQREILALLRSGGVPGGVSTQGPVVPASAPLQIAPADPMFIPSQILPNVQETRMKVSEGEVQKTDIASSAEALRRLKKGK